MRRLLQIILPTLAGLILLAQNAAAVNNPTLGDNPNSPQTITIRRAVEGVTAPVTNTYTYELFDPSNSNLISQFTEGLEISFEDAEPVEEQNYVIATQTFTISDTTFVGVGGVRRIGIREIGSTDPEDYPISDQVFYIDVAVRGDVDATGMQTGHFTPTLLPHYEAQDGTKPLLADFKNSYNSERKHIEFSANVQGDQYDKADTFRFEVTIFGREGEVYTVIAPSGKYTYEDKSVVSDQTCPANELCIVYLHPNESATIGFDGEKDEIRTATRYTIKEIAPPKYEPAIDDEDQDEINKDVKPNQDENKTEFDNKPSTTPQGIKTGVFVVVAPFVTLALVALCAILFIKRTRR